MAEQRKALFIVGPTASGKTDLAIALAKQRNGEIINADSMQVYKELNIGSAKPSDEERQGIDHHLIDVATVAEHFSVAEYATLAFAVMDDILSRGKLPIVCGGTGLYIDALTKQLNFGSARRDEALRSELEAYAATHGNEALWQRLAAKDAATAQRLHPNDTKRIVRALELIHTTGQPIGNNFAASKPQDYNFCIIGLQWNRATLNERIDSRVDRMMQRGLLQEAQQLYAAHDDMDLPGMKGLGYRQLYRHFAGEYTLDEAIERIKIETHQFAKRQQTWFGRYENLHWLDVQSYDNLAELTQAAMGIVQAELQL
ncbi:tRNA (adenosine(37)-N6)-dimethylallyltransferase MiaA [Eubacteriales bacterium OttesenSCG-928-N14]|nr:tRNA (adenosine(37)-N6)-dimethylallyltransferase MiaA [Eubacteriales bacterium OttesenSCG-928-N14]